MFDPVALADSGRFPWPASAPAPAETEPQRLDDHELIELIRGWDRLLAWAQAGQFTALAEFARRRPTSTGEKDAAHGSGVSEFAVDEISAALRLSRAAAGGRLQVAIELDRRLPATALALFRGEVDLPKARAIVDATGQLDDDAAAAVEVRVLPRAAGQTVGQLRASLTRAVLAADPTGAEVRHQRATQGRRVALTSLPDGMAELWALLPADAATAVYSAVDAHARQQPADDARGVDARRADALVALVAGSETTPARPLVHVTVAASTLLGVDEAPGDLAGHGPIPAAMARRIAEDPTGTWRRIVTDPVTGTVLDIGRTSYRPPAAMARQVMARDATCRFPGCRQPAHRCDLDHVRPWPAGPTAAANLIVLCRHHHRLKHRGRWTVTHAGAGAVHWTAPTGHTYTTHPLPRGIQRRPAEEQPGSKRGDPADSENAAEVGLTKQVDVAAAARCSTTQPVSSTATCQRPDLAHSNTHPDDTRPEQPATTHRDDRRSDRLPG